MGRWGCVGNLCEQSLDDAHMTFVDRESSHQLAMPTHTTERSNTRVTIKHQGYADQLNARVTQTNQTPVLDEPIKCQGYTGPIKCQCYLLRESAANDTKLY